MRRSNLWIISSILVFAGMFVFVLPQNLRTWLIEGGYAVGALIVLYTMFISMQRKEWWRAVFQGSLAILLIFGVVRVMTPYGQNPISWILGLGILLAIGAIMTHRHTQITRHVQ